MTRSHGVAVGQQALARPITHGPRHRPRRTVGLLGLFFCDVEEVEGIELDFDVGVGRRTGATKL